MSGAAGKQNEGGKIILLPITIAPMLVPVLPWSPIGSLCHDSFLHLYFGIKVRSLAHHLPCHLLIQRLSLQPVIMMLLLWLKAVVGVLTKEGGGKGCYVSIPSKGDLSQGLIPHLSPYFHCTFLSLLGFNCDLSSVIFFLQDEEWGVQFWQYSTASTMEQGTID